MEVDAKERRWAFQWLLGGGLFAVLVTATLVGADFYLTGDSQIIGKGYVGWEETLNRQLTDLRQAQFSVGAEMVDDRMDREPSGLPAVK